MTLQPEAFLAAQARQDHAKAQERGRHINDLAAYCVGELIAEGYLPSEHRQVACVVLFRILADDIYGMVAVDFPERKEPR